jgi:hypothetical protein
VPSDARSACARAASLLAIGATPSRSEGIVTPRAVASAKEWSRRCAPPRFATAGGAAAKRSIPAESWRGVSEKLSNLVRREHVVINCGRLGCLLVFGTDLARADPQALDFSPRVSLYHPVLDGELEDGGGVSIGDNFRLLVVTTSCLFARGTVGGDISAHRSG